MIKKNNEMKIKNKCDDIVLNTDGYKSRKSLTPNGTPRVHHLLCTTINRKEHDDTSKKYKESEKYVIIDTNSRDNNVNRNRTKISQDGGHVTKECKKKGEESPTSSKLNIETTEHKSKLQNRTHKS